MKTYLLQPNTRTAIGRSGDTGITVQFDALAWYTDYPAGLPYLMVTSPGGRQTPVTVTYADGLISGEVPDELLVRPGLYSYVFAWVSAGEQMLSSPCGAVLLDGVSKRWEPHSAAPDWADRIFLAAESIEQRVNGAIEAEAGAQDAKEGAEAAQDAAEDAVEDAEAAQAAAEAAQALAQGYANAAAESASQAMSGTPEGYADLVSSVGDLKSQFNYIVDYSINKFNPSDYTPDSDFDRQGNIVSGSGTWVSGPINVPSGATHVFVTFLNSQGENAVITTSSTRVGFYGNSYSVSASADTDLPSGTSYIRIKIADTYEKAKVMVDFATTKSDVFVPYSEKIKTACIVVDNTLTETGIPSDAKSTGDRIAAINNTVTELFSSAGQIKGNYFNPDTIEMDYQINSSGVKTGATGYCISAPIAIPDGVTNAVISYTAVNGAQSLPGSFSRVGAYYYKADDTPLQGLYGSHTIPANAAYVILTMNSTYSAPASRRRVMYEFASEATGFIPYTDITNYSGTVEKKHIDLLKTIYNDKPQIKLIGDSITQGVGGTGFAQDGDLIFSDGGTNVWNVNTNGVCWANMFKSHVESIFAGATVKNWGCRGISCADALILGMMPTLIENDDDIVFVMLGTNDRKDTQVVASKAAECYQSNLTAICRYIIGRGKKLVLLSPIPATPAGDAESGVNFGSNVMNEVCTSVAEQIGCDYVNVYRDFVKWVNATGTDYSTLFDDTLHPNDAGYKLIYYLVCNGLGIPNDLTFSLS